MIYHRSSVSPKVSLSSFGICAFVLICSSSSAIAFSLTSHDISTEQEAKAYLVGLNLTTHHSIFDNTGRPPRPESGGNKFNNIERYSQKLWIFDIDPRVLNNLLIDLDTFILRPNHQTNSCSLFAFLKADCISQVHEYPPSATAFTVLLPSTTLSSTTLESRSSIDNHLTDTVTQEDEDLFSHREPNSLEIPMNTLLVRLERLNEEVKLVSPTSIAKPLTHSTQNPVTIETASFDELNTDTAEPPLWSDGSQTGSHSAANVEFPHSSEVRHSQIPSSAIQLTSKLEEPQTHQENTSSSGLPASEDPSIQVANQVASQLSHASSNQGSNTLSNNLPLSSSTLYDIVYSLPLEDVSISQIGIYSDDLLPDLVIEIDEEQLHFATTEILLEPAPSKQTKFYFDIIFNKLSSNIIYEMSSDIINWPKSFAGLALSSSHEYVCTVCLYGQGGSFFLYGKDSSFSSTAYIDLFTTIEELFKLPVSPSYGIERPLLDAIETSEHKPSEIPEPSLLAGLIGLAVLALRKMRS